MKTAADSSRREGGEGEENRIGGNGVDAKTLRSVDKRANRAKVTVN